MKSNSQKKKIFFLNAILFLTVLWLISAQEKTIDLKFREVLGSDLDESKTLQSMVKVRDISEAYSTGGLYLLTHYGDREELFDEENQKAINHPFINQTWRYCSLFSAKTKNGVFMGRNWDNQNVGSIIVNLYHPEGGYSSISFCRAIDMGFPLNVDLEGFKSGELGKRLLLAPFYAMDGINENGLVVAVAGVKQTIVKPKRGRKPVFISFLIRKILDQVKNISEVLKLVDKFIPFDLDQNRLNCHLMVTDSSGQSVILEYVDDEWRKIYANRSWQVITNRPIFKVPESKIRDKCWRCRSISETLEKTNGNIDWESGMKILQDVTQKGTTWSIIYSPSEKGLYYSVIKTGVQYIKYIYRRNHEKFN